MNNDLISRKVLLGLLDNWKDINKYYHPDDNCKNIPVSEVRMIIKDCPTAGEDTEYIQSKRLTREYIKGKNDVLREFEILLEDMRGDV